MRYVDYIIVGGGISGCVLGYTLMKYGASVHVYDLPEENKSSKVAAGLWNPIVLKRLKKVWMADEMIGTLHEVYPDMEKWCGLNFFEPMALRRVFHNPGEQNQWMELTDNPGFKPYLADKIEPTPSGIIAAHGSALTKATGRLRVNEMIASTHQSLKALDAFTQERFDWNLVQPHNEGVSYGDLAAHSIISCEGMQLATGKTQHLVNGFAPVKGEVLKIQLEKSLGKECIHQGHFMLGEDEKEASVGATYAWDGFDKGPTTEKREELEDHIKKVWAGPYVVTDHLSGIRPATKDRRPMVGPHPERANTWIFNGMGSRAVLMAPFLAQVLAEHLLYGAPLLEECLPNRFA